MENSRYKFRAWASQIKQMVYMGGPKCVLYEFDEDEEWGMFFPFKSKQACLSGYDSIMQFTGLHDKNGRDIYEGDLLKHENSKEKDHAFEVIFEDGGFRLRQLWQKEYPNSMTSGARLIRELIYIGNIHENPELCISG